MTGMTAGYQQPAADAIYILATLILSGAGALALYFDVGGTTSRLANEVARQNRETVLRHLQPRRAREQWTPDRILKLYRSMALTTFGFIAVVFVADVVALALNGVR
jgi:hypothetical protein